MIELTNGATYALGGAHYQAYWSNAGEYWCLATGKGESWKLHYILLGRLVLRVLVWPGPIALSGSGFTIDNLMPVLVPVDEPEEFQEPDVEIWGELFSQLGVHSEVREGAGGLERY